MKHQPEHTSSLANIVRHKPARSCQRPAQSSAALLSTALAATLLVGVASSGFGADSATISTSSLINEMTDLAGMAEFPTPSYTCKQFSSYDRKSKSPANPTTEDWFANGDFAQYLRVEDRSGRKEYVMMDATGPGAVVRIWSANPAGTIRIYLDGAEKPVIETPMTDLLGGKFAGLPRPISGEYSKGWNLYFPIPYSKSCKITSDEGKFYYHVNYRTYEPGTKVETFSASQINALADRIGKLKQRLDNARGDAGDFGGQTQEFDLTLEPGKTLSQEFSGPMAFSRTLLRVKAANRESALRGVIVKVNFDGEKCVEAPLGDVFGTGPGHNKFSTLPLGMTSDDEMYCNWFMPFKESATIELVNHTDQEVTVSGEIALKDYSWTGRSMHFHAKWRVQWEVPTRPMIDWNYLTAEGRGVFAGVSFTIDNPVKDWWGEGDEKIYVDGEKFPSHFGTGTEDYYGYAWCWPGLFTHAYHAQPRCDGPGNYGRTSVNRFHIIDRIPFTKSFKFDMELWHWHPTCKVNMGIVAYWYARPGAKDAFQAIRAEDAVVRPLAPYTAPRVAGAIEGETMKILKVTGTADPQDWGGLSDEKHLWWHIGVKPGGTLTVAFPASKAGKYRVYGRFLQARDYGIHQLAINGKHAGDPIDFYNPEVQPTKELLLGEFDLKAGDNEFTATAVGANGKAEKDYMFGLDYLLLKPVE
jgi:hypothetical protein